MVGKKQIAKQDNPKLKNESAATFRLDDFRREQQKGILTSNFCNPEPLVATLSHLSGAHAPLTIGTIMQASVNPVVTTSGGKNYFSVDKYGNISVDPRLWETLDKSPLFGALGGSVTNGVVKIQGKSPDELNKEKLEELTNTIKNYKKDKEMEDEKWKKKELADAEERKRRDEESLKKDKEIQAIQKLLEALMRTSSVSEKRAITPPKYAHRGLCMMEDGSFFFTTTPLNLEPKLRDILELLIARPGELVTYDDIKDECYDIRMRSRIENIRISKYVSKLAKVLNVHFPDVKIIRNVKGQGYILSLE